MYIPRNYHLDNLTKKPHQKSNQQARKHLKYLTPKIPKERYEEFDFEKLSIANHAARKALKYSFTKKLQAKELHPHLLSYYAPCLRGKLNQLIFTMHMKYNVCYPREVDQLQVYRLFGSFKYLKKLVLPETFLWPYVRMARKIKGLQRLKFVMTEAQITKLATLFHNLSFLQVLNIRIFSDSSCSSKLSDQEKSTMVSQTWIFFRDLTALKNLKRLKLQMEDCLVSNDPQFLGDFFELLAESLIEEYDLFLRLEYFQGIKKTPATKKAFSAVDHLEICFHRNYFLSRAPQANLQRTKSLSVVFARECNLDISAFLSNFTNLKNLCVWAVDGGELIIYNNPKPNLNNLEALKLSLNREDESQAYQLLSYAAACVANSQLKQVDIRLTHIKDGLFQKLTKINNTLSPLKTEVYHLEVRDPMHWNAPHQHEKEDYFELVPLKTHMLKQLTDHLSKLRLLRVLELELYLEEPGSVSNIEALFGHLPSLTWLELRLYHWRNIDQVFNTSEPPLMDLPIYKLQKLKHFSSSFSCAFRFRDLLQFFEGVSQMEDLECLKIQCKSIDIASTGTIETIGELLSRLGKLSELYIGQYSSIYFDSLKKKKALNNK